MKTKIYSFPSGVKQVLLALAMTVFGTAFAQSSYTFNYTGGIQTYTAQAGIYNIAMWGADGGNSGNNRAGIGGFSQGTLTLASTTTLYIVVGGSPLYTGSTGLQPGGYNGGGSGYANATGRAGGGATHIATVTGVLSALSSNTPAVIIVAGGGGGDQNAGLIGHGGGLSGGGTYPGTQTGSNGGIFGSFGLGGNITASYGGGGGGGWYGGGGNQNNAGSGGSGYIGGVSNGVTAMTATTGFVTKPVNTMDGLVIITELCSINLSAAGASSSVSPVICAGTSLTLTTDAVSNYSWSTGVTGTNQIVVTPTSNTVISVSGTSSLNCTASRSMSITVSSGNPVLSLNVTPSNSVCLGDSVSITATGALSYTYSGGISAGVKFLPTQNTTFTISGQNGCGTSSIVTTITVTPLSIFAIASTASVCAGNIATLTAAGAQTYTWYPGGSPNNPFNATPLVNTNYTVVGRSGGCYGQTSIQINTIPNPTLQVVGTASDICVGQTVTMTVSGAVTYTWANSSLSGSQVTVSPAAPAAYNVLGTAANGCISGTQYIVLAWPLPGVVANATPTQICVGSGAVLNASGAHNYVWSHGPSGNTVSVSPTVTTNYVVVGTETVHGCATSVTVPLSVYQATISVSQNTAVCPGSTIVLSSGAASSYTWAHGGSGQSTTVSPASTTIYTINATGQVSGMTCKRTNTVEVVVHPAAVVTATAHRTTICRNETTTLTASGGATYLWNTGATSSVVVITGLSAGTLTYNVTGTDQNACKDSHTLSVIVSNCTGIAETSGKPAIRVYPNPGNGLFTVETPAGLELNVINELGQVIRTFTAEQTASGSINITELSRGIYILSAKNDPGVNARLIVE